MFTGIVEETGRVVSITPGPNSIRLAILCKTVASDTRLGDSIAVNGCCLTVVGRKAKKDQAQLEFDLLRETWDRTNLSAVQPGSLVNLERALASHSRLGGHFVTGHIDATGSILRWEKVGRDWKLEIELPESVRRYCVEKGSVAIDGISLTIASLLPTGIRIWIIPHTYEVTALQERRVGDRLNLEADMLAKYVEKLTAHLPIKQQPKSRRRAKRSAAAS